MNDLKIRRPLGAGILSLAFLVAACGAAATPSASPTLPPDATVTSPPSGDPGLAPIDGGPIDGGPIDGGPIGGGGKLVVPKPGQLDVRAVPADEIGATADGSTILVTMTWTSGVEPCNVLDTIIVERGERTFSITLREGHGPEEIACIAIAEQHRTSFEIPDVAFGTYTIRDAMGGAREIQIEVR